MNNHPQDFFKKVRRNFLINESQARQLDWEKKEGGVSQSEIVRKALDFYFYSTKQKRKMGKWNGKQR